MYKNKNEARSKAMVISRSATLQFLYLFLLSVSSSWANSQSAHEDFLKCLSFQLKNSTLVSQIVYAPKNPSFAPILQSSIQNLRFNSSSTPKPQFIVTPFNEFHVQATVICSKKHGLQIRTRSGGHDYEGLSYVSDFPFIVLDMFNLRSISIDIKNENAWIQVGVTNGELYYAVAKRSNVHGFPAGVCPTVGLGGFIAGGGYGFLMRKYGLAADQVIDAYLVDVNGRILNRKTMGEDLFWAIRGGGGSSFGVILSWKVKLVRVPPTVTVFRVEKTLEQNATKIIHRWQYVADKLPHEIFIRLILQAVNLNSSRTVRAAFVATYLGTSGELLKMMAKRFPELGLQKKDCKEMSWIESVLYHGGFTNGEPVEVLLNRTQESRNYLKRKSDYVKEPIPVSGLEGLWKEMLSMETRPAMNFNPYGGRMSEISESAIPFPHRSGNICKIQYSANWNEPGEVAAQKNLKDIRRLYNYMTTYASKNPRGAYLNYRDLDIGTNPKVGSSYVKASIWGTKYFKNNFNRLVDVKTKVDPHNFFTNEQSIPPFYWY